ncbi:MAG: hypothetical protein JWO37_3386 [Acidimicrobiales bacterium]|jgi:hypothetical protein|nr:hypothetical protein [Acidimicrobiales bacterium]
MSKRLRRTRKGAIKVDLPPEERELLRSVVGEMRAVLADGDDPALDRLYPVAYPKDEQREAEWKALIRSELSDHHAAALAVLEETAGAESIDDEQANAWLRALNQVRLLLGTRLDVTEDGSERPTTDDDPRGASFALYDYLAFLQDQLVDALA